ncbi:MAG: TusE/DsrC/DsvC family sulfur relay protein [Spirochaetes bacterium]|nr:TusE/DsrC/DsvC family sulfur relay protein [Spirochaetota bacterium]
MAGAEGKTIKQPYTRTFGGVAVLFNGEGFFISPSPWTEEIFDILAHEAGVEEISDTQRMAVRFIRKFYEEEGKAPLNHHLKVGTGMTMAALEALFPGGIKYGLRRLAGLPDPKGCRRAVGWNVKSD